MRDPDDNETWLIETGHDVMEKKAATGRARCCICIHCMDRRSP